MKEKYGNEILFFPVCVHLNIRDQSSCSPSTLVAVRSSVAARKIFNAVVSADNQRKKDVLDIADTTNQLVLIRVPRKIAAEAVGTPQLSTAIPPTLLKFTRRRCYATIFFLFFFAKLHSVFN
jgi:hypothetical protein